MNHEDIPQTEPIDRIPRDAAATHWRQLARRHQASIREKSDWPAGRVTIPRSRPKRTRPSGNRVDLDYAIHTGCNFLNDEIRAAVEHRITHREPDQTLDETRLRCDLLSSMPMCFNLFGPLSNNQALAAACVDRWFPDLAVRGAPISLHFEWSPGRRDPAYLGDRTAFDVMIRIGTGAERHEIGIETKYHEYPSVTRHKDDQIIPVRYVEVTNTAGLFDEEDWSQRVWNTDIEQVWRDHLLAFACQLHQAGPARTHYVMVAPAGNPSWCPLVEKYQSYLTTHCQQTVEYRSIERLLEEAEGILPHAALFRDRYLNLSRRVQDGQ